MALSFYLDTSVIVNLLTPEPFSTRAEAFAHAHLDQLVMSDFASAEFSSVIARRVRNREISSDQGRIVLADFDAWSDRAALRVEIDALDVSLANVFMRRFDLPLRTPDAIHLAITQRIGAALVTFDRAMTAVARTLGVAVAEA